MLEVTEHTSGKTLPSGNLLESLHRFANFINHVNPVLLDQIGALHIKVAHVKIVGIGHDAVAHPDERFPGAKKLGSEPDSRTVDTVPTVTVRNIFSNLASLCDHPHVRHTDRTGSV